MGIESRIANLEASAAAGRLEAVRRTADNSTMQRQAFCSAVRDNAAIVALERCAAVAEHAGQSGDAAALHREFLALVYPIAVEHLGAEAAEPFRPDDSPTAAKPEEPPPHNYKSRRNRR